LIKEATEAFEKYEFFKFYQAIYNYCVVDLSSFYLDVLKDRMYVYGKDSLIRRSGQTVIYEIVKTVTKLLAPVLVFTSEEVWQELRKNGEKLPSVHLEDWPQPKEEYIDVKLKEEYDSINDVRSAALKQLETLRNEKVIGHPYEAKVVLNISDQKVYDILKKREKDLPGMFIVSGVSLNKTGKHEVMVEKAEGTKCERCWNYSSSVGANPKHPSICARCSDILAGS
jgi:isoleucyl-tRNA synthetase